MGYKRSPSNIKQHGIREEELEKTNPLHTISSNVGGGGSPKSREEQRREGPTKSCWKWSENPGNYEISMGFPKACYKNLDNLHCSNEGQSR